MTGGHVLIGHDREIRDRIDGFVLRVAAVDQP
jgi:hypothetical protein